VNRSFNLPPCDRTRSSLITKTTSCDPLDIRVDHGATGTEAQLSRTMYRIPQPLPRQFADVRARPNNSLQIKYPRMIWRSLS
jgi:hypothetical protein